MSDQKTTAQTITSRQLLEHLQGHRRLTRRVIEAFPEDKLFSHTIGGMRSFGEMCHELLMMGAPGAEGVVKGNWGEYGKIEGAPISEAPSSKKEVLEMWDWTTIKIEEYWAEMTDERFQENDNAYGQWEGKVWWLLMYMIDNEIHHRGQAYVYLRDLGIEPPAFWER